jgi:hypothetical protein
MDNNSKESPEKKRRIGDPTGASSSNQPSAGSNQPSDGNPTVANMNIDYQASTGSNQPSAGSNQPSDGNPTFANMNIDYQASTGSNQPSAGNPTYTDENLFLTPRRPQEPIEEQYEKAEQRHGVGFLRPAAKYREEYYATTQPSTTVFAPYVIEKLPFKSFMADFMNNLSGRY